ncbi:hypothetical protein QE422_002992 [Chryseobacterium sp. SORGH_AS 447]|uniref:hypothetical protein n=1 Tax=Chryseobacterium sp. SORGH_AS_0447 TaxID=3041769 RepID=UPI002784CBC4|nr:hypothetical protein [Chryseobacterium sp. SORGH_AS_0447]MDQ1162624.1 hypothetical protein [Chryseobacterium sp. SORGH_AS_0447]
MSRKLLLVCTYLYALIFSVAKTARFPNKWAESHWMMDYRFGFIKRGLGGEIFGWFFEKDESSIFALSVVILFLLYAAIIGIAVRETIRREKSVYTLAFFVIFLLSQYIVFSAHLIGYLEHLVFLLALPVIYLIRRKKLFLASFIAVFCVFIHEISLFLLLPVSVFAVLAFERPAEPFLFKNVFSSGIMKKLALFSGLPVLAVIFVSFFHEHSGQDYAFTVLRHLKSISFIPENVAQSVTSAYTQSFSLSFQEQKGHFIQRVFISKATIYYGIPILFLLWMIFKEFKLKEHVVLFIVLAAVSFFPLLLHSIAYDTYRIWTFPFMILFLGFWILSSRNIKNAEVKDLSAVETVFFIISFLLVTLIPNVLFDEETERFSLPIKLILIIPVFLLLYALKKPQPKRV